MKKLKIQLLLTGNELMTGDIVDSNSAMIAEHLLPLGLNIQRKVTIADDLSLLTQEINHICEQADILIINGGLGPTIDDLTAKALSICCKTELVENTEALNHIEQWAKNRGKKLDTPQLKQALLPKSANIIPNELGSAVGIHINHLNCDVFCTPGVPSELKGMLANALAPEFSKNHQTFDYQVRRFQIFGIGESSLQSLIDKHFVNWPEEIELGFRAAAPFLELKLTIKENKNLAVLEELIIKIQSLLGAHILGEISQGNKNLAEYLVELLSQQNKSVTFAESCTGGLISSLLTKISGASQVFQAGYVTYSNQVKSTLINVPEETLSANGAVSEEVVLAMAKGSLTKSEADYTIAVSGIAGPNGGSKEKPVGLVWLAWGNKEQLKTTHFIIKGNREYVQVSSANRGLDLLRRLLKGNIETPYYLQNTINTYQM